MAGNKHTRTQSQAPARREEATKTDGKRRSKKTPTRRDWEGNHVALRVAFVALWTRLKRQPTIAELAKETRLGVTAVRDHLKFPFEPLDHPVRLMLNDVAMGVVSAARQGNSAMAKLYFEVFHGYVPQTQVSVDNVTVKIIRGASMDDL